MTSFLPIHFILAISWYYSVATALICVGGVFLFQRWPWGSRMKITAADTAKIEKEVGRV